MHTKTVLCLFLHLFCLQLSAQTVDSCSIFNVFAEAYPCDSMGNFLVDVEFETQAVVGETFEININRQNYGIFEYGEDFYMVGPIEGSEAQDLFILVIDQSPDSCSGFTTLRHPGCNTDNSDSTLCDIRDLFVDSLTCQANGQYFTTIDFIHENAENDFFDLFINGEFVDFYPLDRLPIRVENITLRDSALNVRVCINDNRACCAEVALFDYVNCGDNGGGGDSTTCVIDRVFAEAHACDSLGNFLVDVAFGARNVGETFEIRGNGRSYGIFEYGQDFYTVGPIRGDEARTYEFIVIDQENESCRNFAPLRHPGCGTEGSDSTLCDIRDLFVDSLTCQANGQYFTTIDFIHENAENDFFDLFINGEFVDFYPLDRLPIRVENIALRDSALNVRVCINDNRACCAEMTVFDFVGCESNENEGGRCILQNLEYSEISCQDNNLFAVTLDVTTEYDSNHVVEVYYERLFIGNYELNDFPIRLDNLDINLSDGFWDFTVCSPNIENCCVTDGFTLTADRPFCYGNYVWPGDINLDNVTDYRDLLGIGIAFGATGASRENASLDWLPQYVNYWSEQDRFGFGPHRGHADTNGDGIVNELDLEALLVNYGKTHGLLEPLDSITVSENDPALQFELPAADSLQRGERLSIPISLGTADNPIDDIYGLSFTLQFDPRVINPETVEIEYPTSWLGEPNVNLLSIDKTYADRGLIEIAVTRNDQNNVSGFGEIARFVGMIDDILGYGSVEIDIHEVQAMQLNGRQLPLNIEKITNLVDNTEEIENQLPITLFPNPVTNELNIVAPALNIQQVNAYTLTGQLIGAARNSDKMSTTQWESGIYLIEIQTTVGRVFRKIVKE